MSPNERTRNPRGTERAYTQVALMEKTFDILTDQFRPMVLRYLCTLTRDAHVAEDLAQETFLAAYESIESFDSAGNFGAWLRGIARNKFLHHQRSLARHKLIVDERVVSGVDEVFGMFDGVSSEAVNWRDQLQVLETCISRLSRKLRQAVELTYKSGHSLREVANQLETTPAAIGQRLSRARKVIRQCVSRQMSEGN